MGTEDFGIFIPPAPHSAAYLLVGMVASRVARHFEVPTEVVLQPGEGVPCYQTVRVWSLPYYLLPNGEVVTLSGLIEWTKREGIRFRGTSNYDGVVLVEVIDDVGMDGHTDWSVVGHRVMRGKDVRGWEDLKIRDNEYEALQNLSLDYGSVEEEGCCLLQELMKGD